MPTYTDINQVPIVPGESNARATLPSNAIGTVIDGIELAAPAAPPANTWRLYGDDNGSGKTRLMVRFATGAAQQVAIEP
jgi:hypothetical protein